MYNIFETYTPFVASVTSPASQDLESLIQALRELDTQVGAARLLTSAVGLAGESGEYADIIKKLVFQGKPFTPEVRQHLQKELGDIGFYWIQASLALGLDPVEILQANQDKLTARYPQGEFTVGHSENRKAGDI